MLDTRLAGTSIIISTCKIWQRSCDSYVLASHSLAVMPSYVLSGFEMDLRAMISFHVLPPCYSALLLAYSQPMAVDGS